MNKQDALDLMQSSTDILGWNLNRKAVIKSLRADGVGHIHNITIQASYNKDKQSLEYRFHTVIPKWFFNDIDGSRLINRVLK
jgi:hypothetical protein